MYLYRANYNLQPHESFHLTYNPMKTYIHTHPPNQNIVTTPTPKTKLYVQPGTQKLSTYNPMDINLLIKKSHQTSVTCPPNPKIEVKD